jgi:signal transduction histidine kinase
MDSLNGASSQGSAVQHFRTILIAGFALSIVLLGASALIGMRAMEAIESDVSQVTAERRATMTLVDEIQREENGLSGIFYSLASQRRPEQREQLLVHLERLKDKILRTTDIGLASADPEPWREIRSAALDFIREVRAVLESGGSPSPSFFAAHERLTEALAASANRGLERITNSETLETTRAHERIHFAFLLLGIGLFVAVIAAVATIFVLDHNYGRLRWQAAELDLLSSRSMDNHEETAKRLSRELHDHLGQTLSAIEANIVAIKNSKTLSEVRIEDCLALVKDAIGNVREASQLLRPSILDDFGLDSSLQWLASTFSERTGINVECVCELETRLPTDTETQLFRITQEALTNIARHSGATAANVSLRRSGELVILKVSDNGRGMDGIPDPLHGLGLAGMRARARSAGASLKMETSPGNGVTISLELPLHTRENGTQNTNLHRG